MQSKSPISTLNVRTFLSVAKTICVAYLETLTIVTCNHTRSKTDDKDCNVASDLMHSLDMCILIHFGCC